MVLFTLYFSLKADVNPGLTTSIWSVTPFFMSLADFIIFGNRLKRNHYIGITLIMLCVILLGLRDVLEPKDSVDTEIQKESTEPTVPVIVPITFGLLTPICFTLGAITGKHLSQPRIGFNITNVSFNS
jgi:drug/metabolite transporter (DMT)-like permease